jgi:hypothetical protein
MTTPTASPSLPVPQSVIDRHRVATTQLAEAREHAANFAVQAAVIAELETKSDELDALDSGLLRIARTLLPPAITAATVAVIDAERTRLARSSRSVASNSSRESSINASVDPCARVSCVLGDPGAAWEA